MKLFTLIGQLIEALLDALGMIKRTVDIADVGLTMIETSVYEAEAKHIDATKANLTDEQRVILEAQRLKRANRHSAPSPQPAG